MKTTQWLTISRNGILKVTKSKPSIGWNQIAMKITTDIPEALFKRPEINATLTVTDVPNDVYEPQIVIDTANLIEQQTGAKINFTVVQSEDVPSNDITTPEHGEQGEV